MLIIGLTGSIGMGKSTVAKILNDKGIPVYSADGAVHTLLKRRGKAVPFIAQKFPNAVKNGRVDRKALGHAVFGDPKQLRHLEQIIHPLIRSIEKDFLRQARKTGARAAVLEIPLLFETGAEKRCDVTLCVTAPRTVQKARVLSRPGMTEKKFKAIISRQMPNAKKCRKADYVVPTDVSRAATSHYLEKVLSVLGIGES